MPLVPEAAEALRYTLLTLGRWYERRMADVVFIIGAGCSVHAGAPVMSNFLERARDLLASKEVEDRRKEFETSFEVVSYLQRVHSKARLDHNNIESVFSAVDLARTLGKLPGFQAHDIEGALKSLVWMIVRTLEQTIKFETLDGAFNGTPEYRQLARLIDELSGREPSLSTAILSFNYDIALDLSFSISGLPYTYGFASGEQGVPLLKLHGSLNWGRTRDSARSIVPYDLQHYVRNYRLQHRFPGDGNPLVTSRITAQGMKELRKQMHDVADEPVLVPPTWSKGEYHREIATVWARAAKELAQARQIFVLGYSLPDTDQFFRLLFALGTEGTSILNRIVVFDPNPGPVESRFRDMLGQGALDRFQVYGQKFGEALQTIDDLLFATGKRRPR
jgi:hypothetical protein